MAIGREVQDARGTGLCQLYLGDTAVASQNYGEAAVQFQRSLAIFSQIGDQPTVETLHKRLASLP